MNKKNANYLLAVFNDEHKLKGAGKHLRDNRIKIHDIFTPFPVHGLDELLEIKRTRLPIVCFFAAITGSSVAFYFQYWVSKISWPINVGGKPFNSFMAFVPVAFEITILLGALITVAAFFFRNKLFPGKKGNLPHISCTDDKFVLAIECVDSSINIEEVSESLVEKGAIDIELKRGSQWE